MMPGRIVSIHCFDIPLMKGRDGVIGFRDFSGDIIRAFERHGFIQHSPRITIWKDPVTQMQRTKALGLLHKQVRKDSAMSRQGTPDYIVNMRADGTNPEPIPHTAEDFPVAEWQQLASPVWAQIDGENHKGFHGFMTAKTGGNSLGVDPSDTLSSIREEEDERHICCLQLPVIDRGIRLWTNHGDTVLSPFAGIGSEGVGALRKSRRFIGVELKQAYWQQAVVNLKRAERESDAGELF